MLRVEKMKTSFTYRWFFFAIILAVLDQITKYYILLNLIPGKPINIFPGFNLTLAFNEGIAFGMFSQGQFVAKLLISSLTIIVSLIVAIWLLRTHYSQKVQGIALTLILGGAFGNLWDRFLRGSVVDFLDFYLKGWHWHTFNLADSFICVGAGILFIYFFKKENQNG